ncbi:hypothetical protein J6TS7_63070 [Paenibacillus dendritiformis]|nr:hypothetical protein J6TS7_63070 [Paenibacillus dendritiformis]
MLSIGEFSKICGVSAKTLRYYDEIGLIQPDEINPENGYRYYSISQLKKMLLINRLKSYSFSLEEIKDILEWEEDQAEEKVCSALPQAKGSTGKDRCFRLCPQSNEPGYFEFGEGHANDGTP